MRPRLIALSGPLKATTIALGEEVSIGREASNTVSIGDISVSRHHCTIKGAHEQFHIRDLESHNGTFVNDVPIKERNLAHGDQIKVGNSLFLFLLHDSDPLSASNTIKLNDRTLLTKSAMHLRIEDVLYSVAHDLNILIKVSQAINFARSFQALQLQLLELIFEVVPAQRGAILLFEDGSGEPTAFFGRNKISDANEPVEVSSTIAGRVLREGVALLGNEVIRDEKLGDINSLTGAGVHSFLCVPMTVKGKSNGIIYLDTSDSTVYFGEDHLRMVTVIANLAAGAVESIRHVEWLENENQRLRANLQVEHEMIGESPGMLEIYKIIGRLAVTDSSVLILGESGTGKELVARAIHKNSFRSSKPFIGINCAALTESLLESEFFGHEKGAFTGAVAQKKGKLELADGGIVFLDEIGEMAPALQAKLLRVLQEREFERVGGIRPIKVNIRLIAATNKDLEEAIKNGSFRQDLYYRLNVVSLAMPPLRERREDILLLANYFAAKHSAKCKRAVTGISSAARACLTNYNWPGNVRELENAIERAIVLGTTKYILPEDLPEAILESVSSNGNPVTGYYESVNSCKKQILLKALEQASGNYTEAAKLLGVHPNNLHRLIRSMNLRVPFKK